MFNFSADEIPILNPVSVTLRSAGSDAAGDSSGQLDRLHWSVCELVLWLVGRLGFCLACQCGVHTPSIAFRHLPPNSARFSYATEGALFISAQLSTDAVSALRKVWVRLWKQPSAQRRARKHETHPPRVINEKVCLDSNDLGLYELA